MSFRLNPYTLIKLICIVVFFAYFYIEINNNIQEMNIKTEEILKNFEIRRSGFEKNIVEAKLEEDKSKSLLIEEENKNNVTEKNENTVAENLQENSDNKIQKKEEIKKEIENKKNFKKKYIQAATFKTEEQAKKEAARLEDGFRVNKVNVNGKIVYQVVSKVIEDENTMLKLEGKMKKLGIKYIIRTVGK